MISAIRVSIAILGATLCLSACTSAVTANAPPTQVPASAFVPETRVFSGDLRFLRPLNRTLEPAKIADHVFLSDAVFNRVTVFSRGGNAREITGFSEPQGMTTDGAGTLYVADTQHEAVDEFAPPYESGTKAIIQESNEFPVAVAVSPSGVVATVNICQGSGSSCTGPGSVFFYAKGHTKVPCAKVSGGTKISRLLYAAFNASGTLYVAGVNNYTTSRIGAIPGECSAKTLTVLQPNATVNFAAGVQIDPSGKVAVIDSNGFSGLPNIDVFAPPQPGSRILRLLSQYPLLDSSVVVTFALTKDGTKLYTAEPHYSLVYTYPFGGYALGQLSPPPSGGDLIEGVALTPAEIP